MGANIQGGIPGLPPKRNLGPGMSHPPPSVLTSSDSHQSGWYTFLLEWLLVLHKFMFASIWFSTSLISFLRFGVKMWINSGRKDG